MAKVQKTKYKKSGKITTKSVNMSQSMRGATKVHVKDAQPKRNRIGEHIHALKYRDTYQLQKEVNAMIKESRQRLPQGAKHKANKQITAMKKQFYKSRGLKSAGQLSFKNLTIDDVDAYKEFLLAIKEKYESNTYLNPQKYEEFREKMRLEFEANYGDINADTDELIDIFESDVVDDMKRMGIVYTTAFDLFNQYPDITSEDIVEILRQFLSAVKDENTTSDQFLNFAHDYIELKNDDFKPDGKLVAMYGVVPEEYKPIFTEMLTAFAEESEAVSWSEYVDYYVEKWG